MNAQCAKDLTRCTKSEFSDPNRRRWPQSVQLVHLSPEIDTWVSYNLDKCDFWRFIHSVRIRIEVILKSEEKTGQATESEQLVTNIGLYKKIRS